MFGSPRTKFGKRFGGRDGNHFGILIEWPLGIRGSVRAGLRRNCPKEKPCGKTGCGAITQTPQVSCHLAQIGAKRRGKAGVPEPKPARPDHQRYHLATPARGLAPK